MLLLKNRRNFIGCAIGAALITSSRLYFTKGNFLQKNEAHPVFSVFTARNFNLSAMQPISNVLTDYCDSNFNKDLWLKNYNQIKNKYILEKRLKNSIKISNQNNTLQIISHWASAIDFNQFCTDTKLYQLFSHIPPEFICQYSIFENLPSDFDLKYSTPNIKKLSIT